MHVSFIIITNLPPFPTFPHNKPSQLNNKIFTSSISIFSSIRTIGGTKNDLRKWRVATGRVDKTEGETGGVWGGGGEVKNFPEEQGQSSEEAGPHEGQCLLKVNIGWRLGLGDGGDNLINRLAVVVQCRRVQQDHHRPHEKGSVEQHEEDPVQDHCDKAPVLIFLRTWNTKKWLR